MYKCTFTLHVSERPHKNPTIFGLIKEVVSFGRWICLYVDASVQANYGLYLEVVFYRRGLSKEGLL